MKPFSNAPADTLILRHPSHSKDDSRLNFSRYKRFGLNPTILFVLARIDCFSGKLLDALSENMLLAALYTVILKTERMQREEESGWQVIYVDNKIIRFFQSNNTFTWA
jgi:hypothetical protein